MSHSTTTVISVMLVVACLHVKPCLGIPEVAMHPPAGYNLSRPTTTKITTTTTTTTTTTAAASMLTTALPMASTLAARFMSRTDVRLKQLEDKVESPTSYNKSDTVANKMLYTTTSGHDSELYTVQLQHTKAFQGRQSKLESGGTARPVVYDLKCPKQHFIHPCDCIELDKQIEMMPEGSGADPSVAPTVEMIEEEETVNPDSIETLAFCKNIINTEVLTEALRGFQGHRINFFVLDGCKLPAFPNNLFQNIQIVWMEILNSTLKFHDNFLQSHSCP